MFKKLTKKDRPISGERLLNESTQNRRLHLDPMGGGVVFKINGEAYLKRGLSFSTFRLRYEMLVYGQRNKGIIE